MIRKSKKGFTLAEILVTLGVIGVIASMTVPTLVQDIQDAQFKTAWKKSFAELSQVTQRIVSDNGGTLKSAFLSTIDMKSKYLQYLNYTKSCDSNILGNCWHNDNTIRYLAGSIISTLGNTPAAILNNGSLVKFWYASANCSNTGETIPRCGEIDVDINGFKGPNTIGKDIFLINVLETSLKAQGSIGDRWYPPEPYCSNSSSGYSCGALYLINK